MSMEDKQYLDFIQNFTDCKNDIIRDVPMIDGIKDFDFVDEFSKENSVQGFCEKWCVLAHASLVQDMLDEIKQNPESGYQNCFTREEIVNGEIPEYCSAILKVPTDLQLECEMLGSKILNLYGLPVAYNTGVKVENFAGREEKYILSVDFIRKNEEFIDLNDISTANSYADLKRFYRYGIKNTMKIAINNLKNFLDENGINYTKQDIASYESFLVSSMLVRNYLLGDADFRNGNAGILVNKENKTFRPAPNFDFGELLYGLTSQEKFEHLDEFIRFYPSEFANFLQFTMDLYEDDPNCTKLKDIILSCVGDDKYMVQDLLYDINQNVTMLWDNTKRVSANLGLASQQEFA